MNNSEGKTTELIKKFNFVSKDRSEEYSISIVEILGGVYR
jgi:hypothetical protein